MESIPDSDAPDTVGDTADSDAREVVGPTPLEPLFTTRAELVDGVLVQGAISGTITDTIR